MDRQARLKVINYWNWLLLQCISVLGNQVPDIPAFLIPVRVWQYILCILCSGFCFLSNLSDHQSIHCCERYNFSKYILVRALTCIKQRPIVWHQDERSKSSKSQAWLRASAVIADQWSEFDHLWSLSLIFGMLRGFLVLAISLNAIFQGSSAQVTWSGPEQIKQNFWHNWEYPVVTYIKYCRRKKSGKDGKCSTTRNMGWSEHIILSIEL